MSEELRLQGMDCGIDKYPTHVAPEKTGAADASVSATAAADSSFSILHSSFDYYQLGNKYRREGNWQEAINNYVAAIELDPDSPAVEAKQMLDDILGYYNKDMYNP